MLETFFYIKYLPTKRKAYLTKLLRFKLAIWTRAIYQRCLKWGAQKPRQPSNGSMTPSFEVSSLSFLLTPLNCAVLFNFLPPAVSARSLLYFCKVWFYFGLHKCWTIHPELNGMDNESVDLTMKHSVLESSCKDWHQYLKDGADMLGRRITYTLRKWKSILKISIIK